MGWAQPSLAMSDSMSMFTHFILFYSNFFFLKKEGKKKKKARKVRRRNNRENTTPNGPPWVLLAQRRALWGRKQGTMHTSITQDTWQ